MFSDFSVKFKFGADNNCISRVYAVDTVKSRFLVTYSEYFIWIDISECKLYDPILEDDYDNY